MSHIIARCTTAARAGLWSLDDIAVFEEITEEEILLCGDEDNWPKFRKALREVKDRLV